MVPRPSWRAEAFLNPYIARILVAAASLLALSACVVYEPVYATGGGTPATFERAWNAALGSYQDQGVAITAQDRTSGVIEGARAA